MCRGFSLVELSIVLVILGLLTGGILTGQSLIRAAELRNVATELQAYQTAARTFQDKYFQLPGDLSNATEFWGAATCPTAAGTGTQTCDGDGDGEIEVGSASEFGERFTFWQHLANAGLIEGSYTGMAGPNHTSDVELGINAPTSKSGNTGWHVHNLTYSSNVAMFDGPTGNSLTLGEETTNMFTQDAAFTPEETWNIDKKIDDGMPAQGKMWAVQWNDCTDATSSADMDAEYLLSDSSVLCAIIFHDAF